LLGKLREDVETQVSAGLERERWQQDIKRAHEIQMGMLPSEDLITNTFEISGFCQPATDVGGDYYDYQILNKDQVGVIIGDVTGHGFYSGLFVAMAKTCLHLQARIEDRPTIVRAQPRKTMSPWS
ncbi:MAG: SpoIIE family protein phosphatase, partial [bacterium]|nr:SpoIIE family protein phosphatase [bacterium]